MNVLFVCSILAVKKSEQGGGSLVSHSATSVEADSQQQAEELARAACLEIYPPPEYGSHHQVVGPLGTYPGVSSPHIDETKSVDTSPDNKSYAVSVVALRQEPSGATGVGHVCYLLQASGRREASEAGLSRGLVDLPRADGWCRHDVAWAVS